MKNFGGGGIGGPTKSVNQKPSKGKIPQRKLPEVKTAGVDDNYVP